MWICINAQKKQQQTTKLIFQYMSLLFIIFQIIHCFMKFETNSIYWNLVLYFKYNYTTLVSPENEFLFLNLFKYYINQVVKSKIEVFGTAWIFAILKNFQYLVIMRKFIYIYIYS